MTRAVPPIRVGDEVTLEIADLAYGGKGVARISGFVVFVNQALPGEVARARVVRLRPGYAEAKRLEIVTASPRRIEPPCRHFGVCGGCDLQHLSRADQADAKRRQVMALLMRVAGVSDPSVGEVLLAGDPFHYRFRIDYDFGPGPGGSPRLGLHRSGRPGEIVPVETCLLVPETADRIRGFLERRTVDEGSGLRMRTGGRVFLRRAGIQMARATGEILVTLETRRGNPPALVKLARDLGRAFPRIVGVVRREFDRQDRFVEESILQGRDHLFEVVDGDLLKIPAGAFFQPNATAWSILRRVVMEALEASSDQSILELYCGVGFFTLPAARQSKQVIALDASRAAIAAARVNAASAGIGNVRLLCGDVEEDVGDLLEETRHDAILIDPPRAGLPRAVAHALARGSARHIVYVSCDPATLARDLRILLGDGRYGLRSVVPLDLFPQTHHVECVARLDTSDAKKGW
jgi:23S rRNA (uracil1939-C5)-methyltransferase